MGSIFANSSWCRCLCWLTEPSLPSLCLRPTWRAPSQQVQPIDQTFYFHAADRWGAEARCSQVCKGAQGPPLPPSPVTVTNCPEADDKSGQLTSPWENAKQLKVSQHWEICRRLCWAAERLSYGRPWSASSQPPNCLKVFLQGHPAADKEENNVGADCAHTWCFMIASLIFSPFSTMASLLLVSLPPKPNLPPEGLHQAACCWVTGEDCGSGKLSVEYQQRCLRLECRNMEALVKCVFPPNMAVLH